MSKILFQSLRFVTQTIQTTNHIIIACIAVGTFCWAVSSATYSSKKYRCKYINTKRIWQMPKRRKTAPTTEIQSHQAGDVGYFIRWLHHINYNKHTRTVNINKWITRCIYVQRYMVNSFQLKIKIFHFKMTNKKLI